MGELGSFCGDAAGVNIGGHFGFGAMPEVSSWASLVALRPQVSTLEACLESWEGAECLCRKPGGVLEPAERDLAGEPRSGSFRGLVEAL